MVAQWVCVGVHDDKLPIVYQIYQHLLDDSVPANDQAVRITTGKRLLDVVKVITFRADLFAPFASSILSSLSALIGEVNLVETKLALLDTLSAVIKNMDLQVGSLADQIVNLLPPLWEESGTEYMLKKAVVDVLANLVASLKVNSAPLHPLVIPVIKEALDPQSDSRAYLQEDALELMHQVVMQSKSASDELVSLLHFILPTLEWDSELLILTISAVKSMLLLAPTQVLSDERIRRELFGPLTNLMTAKKNSIRDPAADVVELASRCAEQSDLANTNAASNIVSSMVDCGLLTTAISSIVQENANGTSRSEDGFLNFFVLFARIILYSPTFLFQIAQSWLELHYPEGCEEVLPQLMEKWVAYMKHIYPITRQKLMCLAFAKLIGAGHFWILKHFESLMPIWIDTVKELHDEDGAKDEYVTSNLLSCTHGKLTRRLAHSYMIHQKRL